MCGRYTLRKGLDDIAKKLGSHDLDPAPPVGAHAEPRYNIAPTQSNLVLRNAPERRGLLRASALRWGLVPSWSKTAQTQSPMINARSETVAEKPSFRAAFQRRRCLVPADGFYEWKARKGASLPHFFSMADDSVFFMAGIWETWSGEDHPAFDSFTLLTTHANPLMARYHDRMPVIIPPERIEQWMEADGAKLGTLEQHDLFAPISPELMTCRPANPIVNNNRSEGPQCLEPPAESALPQLDLEL